MAGITYILWMCLLLVFLAGNIVFVTCQEPTDEPGYIYFDANSDSFDFSDFLPPTPYLPNNGEYVYKDYENLYPFPDFIPCEQRKRCQRRNQDYDLDLRDQNCFCDDRCKAYSDCCLDYDLDEEPRSSIILEKSAVSCGLVREIEPNSPILLVDSCPRDMDDDYLRDQCEIYYPENGFLNLPVSSKTSGILYKNVYCAICSGESEVDFWAVEYQCLSPPASASNADQLDAKLALDETLDTPQGCTRVYSHDMHTVRFCKPDVISRCDREWKDKRIKRRCKSDSDTSYVYYAQSRIFKNIYCAMCNYVNESRTSCIDDVTEPPQPPVMPGVHVMGTPFSVLLDLNKGNAGVSVKNMVGMSGEMEKTEIVVELRQCPESHVYDPFSRMCRLIGCATGQKFENGLCISNPNESAQTTRTPRNKSQKSASSSPKHRNNSMPDSGEDMADTNEMISPLPTEYTDGFSIVYDILKCPTISYAASEYMLQNGSVEIFSTGYIYDDTQYVIGPSKEVYVCSPFSSRNYNVTFNETQVIIMFKFNTIQSFVSVLCLVISLVSLATVFVVYLVLPSLQNIPGKCLISLVVALFWAHLLFLVGTQQTKIQIVCHVIGATLHYFFLASFFWMNVLALDICTTFTSKTVRTDENSHRFVFYSLYAWLAPAVIVGGSVALDFVDMVPEQYQPHYATDLCWISRRDALFYLFAAPLGVILIINFILFLITIISICVVTRATKMAQQKRKQVGLFILYVKLGLIMGLCWVFGFIATLTDYKVLWYVFIALNALQGFFICIAFVCTRKVFGLIANLGKPERRKGATVGGYYACSNGSTNGTITRHTGLYDPSVRLELESQETSI